MESHVFFYFVPQGPSEPTEAQKVGNGESSRYIEVIDFVHQSSYRVRKIVYVDWMERGRKNHFIIVAYSRYTS